MRGEGPIDLVLGRLAGVRPSGSGWVAQCPTHDDRHASLTIGMGEDGQVLLHCHATSGCTAADIAHALDLTLADLFPPRDKAAPRFSPNRETVYAIKDLAGLTVASHHRLDLGPGGKRFWWRLPGARENGLGGRHTADLPLYGSEQLAALPPGTTVVVTEGEQAADALTHLGLSAVATVTGATATPADAVLAVLRGFDVVLWPDNDPEGAGHMARIAAALAGLKITPHVVSWPDAPPKGDAADAPEDEIPALIGAAPPWTPAAPTPTGPILRMSQVEREEVHWLWRPYLPLGKLTLLEGDPGVGKSWLSLALATAVSRGAGPPGMELAAPGTTLLLTAEDGLGDTVGPRLDLLGADGTRIFALRPDQPVTLVDLEMLVIQVQPVLVIVDPLAAFLGRDIDMFRSNETRPVLAAVAAMAERQHCAVLIVRHITKGAAGRAIYRGQGSIDFTAAARSVLLAGCDPEEPQKCALIHIKSNLAAKGDPIDYRLEASGFSWGGVSDLTASRILGGTEGGEAPSKLADAIDFLQQALSEGDQPAERMKADAKALDISTMTLRRAREALGVRTIAVGKQRTGGVLRWDWQLPNNEGDHSPYTGTDQVRPLRPDDDEYYRRLAEEAER